MAAHTKKTCASCGRTLSIRAYYRAGEYRRFTLCRQCYRANQRARYWRDVNLSRLRGRANRANYRAAVYGRPGRITAADLAFLLELSGGKCHYCHADLADGFQIDHKLALSRPGSMNTLSNLAICCPACNRQKFTALPIEFIERRQQAERQAA